MDKLAYDLRKLCERNRDGSYNTQSDLLRTLTLVNRQLRGTTPGSAYQSGGS